jgi:hypothetical protein
MGKMWGKRKRTDLVVATGQPHQSSINSGPHHLKNTDGQACWRTTSRVILVARHCARTEIDWVDNNKSSAVSVHLMPPIDLQSRKWAVPVPVGSSSSSCGLRIRISDWKQSVFQTKKNGGFPFWKVNGTTQRCRSGRGKGSLSVYLFTWTQEVFGESFKKEVFGETRLLWSACIWLRGVTVFSHPDRRWSARWCW